MPWKEVSLMNNESFRLLLSDAIAGDMDALAELFQMYRPLIDRYSYVDGILNEDLRQYILLHVFEKLSQFKI